MEVAMPVNVPAHEDKVGPQRPENVPEKFWNKETGKVNYDAVLGAYTELEKRLGSPDKSKEAPADPGEKPVDKGNEFDLPQPTDKPAKTTGDLPWTPEQQTKWQQEYETTGKLSEDTYKEIPYPRPLVDGWIAGQEALRQMQRQTTFALVGGEDKYAEVANWAANNLDKTSLETYSKAIRGSLSERNEAVKGLYARYKQANGEPAQRTVTGSPSAGGGGMAYESKAQMLADMRSTKYKGKGADPAFHAYVLKRVAATPPGILD